MTREEAIKWFEEAVPKNCSECQKEMDFSVGGWVTSCNYSDSLRCEAYFLARAALREQEELADLLEAKREGRLVVLPCKLGADIFRLGAKEVCAHWQTAYATVYPDEIVMVDDSDNLIFIEDIGKSVFLTREEAEKALKEDA